MAGWLAGRAGVGRDRHLFFIVGGRDGLCASGRSLPRNAARSQIMAAPPSPFAAAAAAAAAGMPYRTELEGGQLRARFDLQPARTAGALHAALDSGGLLPRLPLVPDFAAGQLPPSAGQEDARGSATLLLRELGQLTTLRAQLEQQQQQGAAGASPAAGVDDIGAPPALAGRYAPAARRLAAWVAELLAVQHRNQGRLLKQFYSQTALGGTTPRSAESSLAVCERNRLLTRIDALWSDFLLVGGGSRGRQSPACMPCVPCVPVCGRCLAALPALPSCQGQVPGLHGSIASLRSSPITAALPTCSPDRPPTCPASHLPTQLLAQPPASRPLQDTKRVRSLCDARSFSSFDPLQEFQLESGQLFARMLLGAQAPAAVPAAVPHMPPLRLPACLPGRVAGSPSPAARLPSVGHAQSAEPLPTYWCNLPLLSLPQTSSGRPLRMPSMAPRCQPWRMPPSLSCSCRET